MYFVYTPSYLLRKLFERRKKSQGIECCSKRLGCNLLGHSSSGLPLKWPHAAGCDWKLDFTGSFFFQPGLERCNLQRSWFQGPVLLYGEATSRVNGGIKKRAVLSFLIATQKKQKKKTLHALSTLRVLLCSWPPQLLTLYTALFARLLSVSQPWIINAKLAEGCFLNRGATGQLAASGERVFCLFVCFNRMKPMPSLRNKHHSTVL